MNNMNFCYVLKTNCVQTELQTLLQTDGVSCRGALLLKIIYPCSNIARFLIPSVDLLPRKG